LLAKENGKTGRWSWLPLVLGPISSTAEKMILRVSPWAPLPSLSSRMNVRQTFDLFTTLITGTSRENVKEFELWQGNESPNGSFQLIGTFQTQNVKLFKTPDQEFRFLPVTAKYLKLKINSAWDPSYGVHLRRVQLFGTLQ
jgi:hypothetical protein